MKIVAVILPCLLMTVSVSVLKSGAANKLEVLQKPQEEQLTVNYGDLKFEKSKIRLVLKNPTSKSITIRSEIIDLKLQGQVAIFKDPFKLKSVKLPPGIENQIELIDREVRLDQTDPAKLKPVEISPKETIVLEFGIHDPESKFTPLPGLYKGVLRLRQEDNISIYSSILHVNVAIPKLKFVDRGLPDLKEIKFEEYENTEKRVQVAIKNEGEVAATLTGTSKFPTLLCSAGLYPKTNLFQLHADASPVTIDGGETKILTFDLTSAPYCQDKFDVERADSTLVEGAHKGQLIIRDSKQKVSLTKDLKLIIPSITTADQWILGNLKDFYRQFASLLGKSSGIQVPKSMGGVTWLISSALLTVFIVLGWRRGKRFLHRLLRAKYKVEIQNIIGSSKTPENDIGVVTATMRERLTDCGSPLASVAPGVSVAQEALTAIGTLAPTHGKGVSTIGKAILGQFIKPVQYIVTGTLVVQKTEPKVALTLELKDSITNKIEEIRTFESETREDVAGKAAYFIHYVSTRFFETKKPNWTRFPTFGSFLDFKVGQTLEQNKEYALAEKKYFEAAKAARNNAEVRLRQGALLERAGHEGKNNLTRALRLYLTIAYSWPHFLEAQYRLAITYTFKSLENHWKDLVGPLKEKEDFLSLHSTIFTGDQGTGKATSKFLEEKDINREYFLMRANETLVYLKSQLKFRSVLLNLLKTFWPFAPPYATERRYWLHYFIYPRARVRFYNMAQMVHHIVELELKDTVVEAFRVKFIELKPMIEKLIKENWWNNWWNNWNVYYNAMCFYSIAYKHVSAQDKKECLDNALRLQKKILKDPDSKLKWDWLMEDPDLENLRSERKFQSILQAYGQQWSNDEQEANSKTTGEKQLTNLHMNWGYLENGAKNQVQVFEQRFQEVKRWRNIHFADLNKWCQEESEIWDALGDWGRSPYSSKLREAYWTRTKGGNTPTLAAVNGQQEGLSEDEALHDATWHEIAECGSGLANIWEARRKATELATPNPIALTIDDVRSWIAQEKNLWGKLFTLSTVPLEDWALQDFQKLISSQNNSRINRTTIPVQNNAENEIKINELEQKIDNLVVTVGEMEKMLTLSAQPNIPKLDDL